MAVTQILPICCVCGQVSDRRAGASVEGEWTQLQTYLDRHHIDQTSIRLSHTYCPSCYQQQARVWRVPPHAPLAS
jgi:uncharacterized protein (UPF0212 family)